MRNKVSEKYRRNLLKDLNKAYSSLKESYKNIDRGIKEGGIKTNASEWILDNTFLLEREFKSVKKSLPEEYFLNLPIENNKKLPRVYYIAKEIIKEEVKFDDSNLAEFVLEKNENLTYGEVVSFPILLKIYLLIKICNIGKFIGEFYKNNTDDLINSEIEEEIEKSIITLRKIEEVNWSYFFKSTSKMEGILNNDPSKVYEEMEEESKDYYRHKIEELSRKYNINEVEISLKALELALINLKEGRHGQTIHIGYYIVDFGRYELLESLGIKEKVKGNGAEKVFISLNVFGSIALALIILCLSYIFQWEYNSLVDYIITFFIILVPCSEIIVSIINHFTPKVKSVSHIPKIHFKNGITEINKTSVVVPTIIESKEKIDYLIEKIKVSYLANKDENAYFIILGDFIDSKVKENEKDIELFSYGVEKIKELNEETKENRFFLLIRERIFDKSEEKYIGWERKRGKLIEFMKFLRGENNTTYKFISSNTEVLKNSKYVITIDTDTFMKRNTLKRLVGAMSHPLNKPKVSVDRVTRGYGILQPKISISLESKNKTKFSKIFGGDSGVDGYSTAYSDTYQDLFNKGSFTGKGIIHIDTFLKTIDGKIKEDRVLSHDLLEGELARCGLITDCELIEEYPSTYIGSIRRLHRWIRGDFQLIKWIFKKDISIISRWKIFDNIRRSLLAPSLLISLWISFIFLRNGRSTVIIIFLTLLTPILFRITDFVVTPKCKLNGNAKSLVQVLLIASFIPYQGIMALDAIIRSMYRLFISKKKLLEWRASDIEDKEERLDINYYTGAMWFSVLSGLITIFLGFEAKEWVGVIGIIIGVLWILAPFLALNISREEEEEELEIKGRDIDYLLKLSKDIWNYYNDFVTKENNYLPPDNYQEEPLKGEAKRTSPTNIGLALVCNIAAKDLGFISEEKCIERCLNTLKTMDTLERFNGHFLNWYNIETKESLKERYVSTVDSGNLLSYLMICKEFFKDKNKEVNYYLDKFINEMDFTKIYDKKKELFYIGYNIDRESFGNAHYDLLASEARMASFLAISRGEVSESHWFKLKRGYRNIGFHKTLISWTGTMFEYLMPALIMKNFKGSILDSTYKGVLEAQINYGKRKKIPFGISEGAYYKFDLDKNYQYKAFGIEKIRMKREIEEELVITPYASIMAMQINFKKAFENLKRMDTLGAYGKYGFIESIDYTPNRINKLLKEEIINEEDKRKGLLIKTYMVHHLGMSLLALDNILEHNIMIERFHNISEVKATELLLKEKKDNLNLLEKEGFINEEFKIKNTFFEERIIHELEAVDKEVNLMSNGKYSLMINSLGGSYSKYEEESLYRWGGEFLSEEGGVLFYIKEGEKLQSPTFYPFEDFGESYKVKFSESKSEIYKIKDGLETKVKYFLSPEDDLEVRTLSIKNLREEKIDLEIVSYLEPIITTLEADLAHMTFSNLFIETEYINGENIIIAKRRKRKKEEEEKFIYVGFFNEEEEKLEHLEFTTSRECFIERNNSLKNPKGIFKELKNESFEPLDPCIAIKKKISLEHGEEKTLNFILGFTKEKKEIIEKVNKYKDRRDIINLKERYNKLAKLLLNKLSIKAEKANIYEKILREMIYLPQNRKFRESYIKNLNGCQEDLWKYGISGDKKIIFVRILKNKKLLKDIVKMHYYYELKGIYLDLIIYNEEANDYYDSNKREIEKIVNKTRGEDIRNIFIFNKETLEKKDREMITAIASLFFDKKAENLDEIVKKYEGKHILDRQIEKDCKYLLHLNGVIAKKEKEKEIKIEEVQHNLDFFNGYGGFNKEDGSYEIILKDRENTPRPWINVLTNKSFGGHISETGSGYTWCENSRENKITPWSNDYIKDPMSEGIWFRENNTLEKFSIFKKPFDDGGIYKVNHNFGYSTFNHSYKDIEGSITVFIPNEDNLKIQIIKLKNSGEEKSISVFFYNELVMGENKLKTGNKIYTEIYDEFACGINNYSTYFKEKIAYGTIIGEGENYYTCDKDEGMNILKEEDFENITEKSGASLNPCILVQKNITLKKDEEIRLVCILGEEESIDKIKEKIEKYKNISNAFEELNKVKVELNNFLGNIKINTGDKSFDYMMNGWLLYQNYNCRYLSRSAFYQSGGAYGFRDQMQDSLSLGIVKPEILRERILENSKRQYKEGDVQHWWHPKVNSGIRTRFSDDLLWLPYGVIEYIKLTGDYSILDEKTPYLDDEILKDGEDEKYTIVNKITKADSIYNHCIKAIDKALNLGEHNIPLMGSGDWNDGMSTVGNKGKGESIWLGWFLAGILKNFRPFCEKRGDIENKNKFIQMQKDIVEGIEKDGFDGEWYKRAYFDDGTPLGSKENEECFIDSLPQSFAVISGLGDKERSKKAMESVEKHLIDKENSIIKLLYPPFSTSNLEPGYIKGYVPGVRENGGQYTHGAAWVILAFSMLKENEKAYGLYSSINPITHSNSKEKVEKYKNEPYVMSADVYIRHPYEGRGGWSYYTGAAGWMYKIGIENFIGLNIIEGKGYEIKPNLPKYIDKFTIEIKDEKYKITCIRGEKRIIINGKEQENTLIMKGMGESYIEVYY